MTVRLQIIHGSHSFCDLCEFCSAGAADPRIPAAEEAQEPAALAVALAVPGMVPDAGLQQQSGTSGGGALSHLFPPSTSVALLSLSTPQQSSGASPLPVGKI